MILHGYWRSTAAYRVRIALNLKGVAFTQRTYDLRTGEQHDDAYAALNPQRLVPALETDDGVVLTQSSAIIEWLDATYSYPPLLPADPVEAAIVRAIAGTIGADIHPINNLRVLKMLREDFGATEPQVSAWMTRWITAGFEAIEPLVERHGRGFAFGDTPTLADCYIVPQIYSADRFGIDLSAYPHLRAAGEKAGAVPAFEAAQPASQPDAD